MGSVVDLGARMQARMQAVHAPALCLPLKKPEHGRRMGREACTVCMWAAAAEHHSPHHSLPALPSLYFKPCGAPSSPPHPLTPLHQPRQSRHAEAPRQTPSHRACSRPFKPAALAWRSSSSSCCPVSDPQCDPVARCVGHECELPSLWGVGLRQRLAGRRLPLFPVVAAWAWQGL